MTITRRYMTGHTKRWVGVQCPHCNPSTCITRTQLSDKYPHFLTLFLGAWLKRSPLPLVWSLCVGADRVVLFASCVLPAILSGVLTLRKVVAPEQCGTFPSGNVRTKMAPRTISK